LALEARPREAGPEALGELGLAHAWKAGHVHRDARLQADSDQLNEVSEFHLFIAVAAIHRRGVCAGAWTVCGAATGTGSESALDVTSVGHPQRVQLATAPARVSEE